MRSHSQPELQKKKKGSHKNARGRKSTKKGSFIKRLRKHFKKKEEIYQGKYYDNIEIHYDHHPFWTDPKIMELRFYNFRGPELLIIRKIHLSEHESPRDSEGMFHKYEVLKKTGIAMDDIIIDDRLILTKSKAILVMNSWIHTYPISRVRGVRCDEISPKHNSKLKDCKTEASIKTSHRSRTGRYNSVF
jgi:hypothetical protein